MLIGINIDNQLELDDDGEEEEDNRMVVTLARSFLILSSVVPSELLLSYIKCRGKLE